MLSLLDSDLRKAGRSDICQHVVGFSDSLTLSSVVVVTSFFLEVSSHDDWSWQSADAFPSVFIRCWPHSIAQSSRISLAGLEYCVAKSNMLAGRKLTC